MGEDSGVRICTYQERGQALRLVTAASVWAAAGRGVVGRVPGQAARCSSGELSGGAGAVAGYPGNACCSLGCLYVL